MEKYLNPEMDIVEFETEDVITTSCPPDKPACPNEMSEIPILPPTH